MAASQFDDRNNVLLYSSTFVNVVMVSIYSWRPRQNDYVNNRTEKYRGELCVWYWFLSYFAAIVSFDIISKFCNIYN